MLKIEVVYCPSAQVCETRHADFVPGMTVSCALVQSGLLHDHPEIEALSYGVFSKIVSRDTILKPGDRVEVYRPLCLDPKETRRQRARASKARRKASRP